jgi:hypothetical protein
VYGLLPETVALQEGCPPHTPLLRERRKSRRLSVDRGRGELHAGKIYTVEIIDKNLWITCGQLEY